MSKLLIYGIGGFVGSYLAKEFLDHGYEVFGCDMAEGAMLPKEVKFKRSDLMDAQKVEADLEYVQPDMIINLAAISSVGASWNMPQTTMMVNVVGALNILEAARKLENKPKIMFIGSSEEYEASDLPMNEEMPLNANNPYGISKMTQENFAKLYREQYGMQVYCVRAFNHTGVGQRDSFVLPSFCKQVAAIDNSGEAGVIKVGNLAAKRDFCHVKDMVRAYRMIIESDDCTEGYNVGSGNCYGLDEILKYIVELSSLDIEVEVDPERVRPIDTPVVCCDRSKIEKKLGWIPEYTVFDALQELYRYYKETLR